MRVRWQRDSSRRKRNRGAGIRASANAVAHTRATSREEICRASSDAGGAHDHARRTAEEINGVGMRWKVIRRQRDWIDHRSSGAGRISHMREAAGDRE